MLKKQIKQWLMCMLMLALPLTGACETKVLGMTARDYFGDTLEAKVAIAAGRGDAEEVKRLVARGANVNAVGKENLSPLGWAMAQKNLGGMRALLEAGADPNQPIGPKKNLYPVWIAAGLDNSDQLKLLLDFKGEPNVIIQSAQYSALSRAVTKFDNVRLLVEAGADVNTTDPLGGPFALDAAALAQIDIVLYLLDKGFNQNLFLLAWEMNDRRPGGPAPFPEVLEPKRLQVLAKLKEMGVAPPSGTAPPNNPPRYWLGLRSNQSNNGT